MESPYLEGAYAPVDREIEAELVAREGAIPDDVAGSYVRNGPNPRFRAEGGHHWFDGDGMLHAARIADGRVFYRNRWIRTAGFRREEEAGKALWRGLMEPITDNPRPGPGEVPAVYKDTANTDVVAHGGRLLTSWYVSGGAHRVHPETLETEGLDTFGGERPLRLSAHTKVDERTGELFFFDYGPTPPFLQYGVVSPTGTLEHRTTIDLPGPRLPHDMALTENHAILMDLPVFYRPEALKKKKWIVGYHPELPARFGVLPRRGDGASIRWFEAEPCYVYHVVNAWEEDEAIVMIGCRCDEPIPAVDPADGAYARALANLRVTAHLHRWRFDLRTGETTETPLDDLSAEFPVIDTRRTGVRSRYSYHQRIPRARTLIFDGVVKYDTDGGERKVLELGPGQFGSEVAFAPRVGASAEDDGYLFSFVDDRAADRSELWITRAQDLEVVAKCTVPQRVPAGFHACWMGA
ncbi:MAG: 9-cis-epoxycarotenoid dioxygenase [Sandaracinus sp.]|nr:9-cis-epoxycarotenoid dioxygenase [Sandaracinus sp.]|tara:strand:+ start:1309 stop:2703 length:1395 start_codon:yes stop_codon:yes gene_type:complete